MISIIFVVVVDIFINFVTNTTCRAFIIFNITSSICYKEVNTIINSYKLLYNKTPTTHQPENNNWVQKKNLYRQWFEGNQLANYVGDLIKFDKVFIYYITNL